MTRRIIKFQKQGEWYKVTLKYGSSHFTRNLADAIALIDKHRTPLFILQSQYVHRTHQSTSIR